MKPERVRTKEASPSVRLCWTEKASSPPPAGTGGSKAGPVVMHAEINCLYNAGKSLEDFRGMTMYSTLMPCNMCAGAIVQFGIAKVVAGESENFEENGLDLLIRHGVEVIDMDMEEPKDLLRKSNTRHADEWNRDIGRRA